MVQSDSEELVEEAASGRLYDDRHICSYTVTTGYAIFNKRL
jgi:hypothetical protein